MANPPTLILVIENLLNFVENNKIHDENITGASGDNNYCIKKDGSTNNDFGNPSDYSYSDGNNIENCHIDSYNETNILIYQFLNEMYPALNEWISWFLDSQKGPSSTIDVEDTEGMTLRYDYLKVIVLNLLCVFHLIIVSIHQSIFEFNKYYCLNCKKWIHPFFISSDFFSIPEHSTYLLFILFSPPLCLRNFLTLGSFRWRGRAINERKLIANTLASGLLRYIIFCHVMNYHLFVIFYHIG